MSDKHFKLFCKDLDEIVSVRSFSQQAEANMYEKFRSYLTATPSSFRVKDYKRKLVDSLLVDASSFFVVLDVNIDEELQVEVTDALYSTIIEAYPHFEFEFICNDINNTIAFDQMRSVLTKHMEQMAGPTPKPQKKSIKSYADLVKLSKKLNREIIGQEEACEKTINAIKLLVSDISDFSSFFYIGPTGVGKTKLAKVLGDNFSGNFLKVNCGEYSAAHDYAKLIGAPPGYVGHSDSSLLGEKAAESNSWVILFDEIEKANTKFYDFLLSLLDDGTCTDNMGNVLDFSQSIFIFTTNEGIQDSRFGESRVGFSKDIVKYEESQDVILNSIKKTFSPEFLNRIDHFIFFNRLKEQELKKITRLELHYLPIKRTHQVVNYIIKNSNHQEYGARNIAKYIKNNIATIIADAILKKKIPLEKNAPYIVKVSDNNLYISNIEEDTNGWTN